MPLKEHRDFTAAERRGIRKLVIDLCANYDTEYGCLPTGKPCYMLGARTTEKLCKYFRDCVLPDNPALEAALTGSQIETKPCAVCGKEYAPTGRQVYCSDACEAQGTRIKNRSRKQKQRAKVG